MSKDEEEAAHNRKQRQDPNPERSGKAKNVATECWKGYKKKGMKKKGDRIVPNCVPEENLPVNEGKGEKDACYHKVKSRFKIWPSAYASGALVKCRKKGAANWGKSTKKEELAFEGWQDRAKEAMRKVAGKKPIKKHDYGRDAGKVARELMRKKDHQTVNFLDPDD